jgi:lyso-ornithine lipid O-acyltransferase
VSQTWYSETVPVLPKIGAMGWLRVVGRGVPLICLIFGGLLVLLLIRLVERPAYGLRRPVTPWITQAVCSCTFFLLGMRYQTRGAPMLGPGVVVSNHASWLDIFALNGGQRIYFVAKAEVAGWPGIGWLARATGTLFIRRDRGQAQAQVRIFKHRLAAGQKLLLFPEGTSTDGFRVLPFKPTLFAALVDPGLQVQPVSVLYHAPTGADPRVYGWWGNMAFGPHLLAVLALARQGGVTVIYHPPLCVADYSDRKALALAAETIVRSGVVG